MALSAQLQNDRRLQHSVYWCIFSIPLYSSCSMSTCDIQDSLLLKHHKSFRDPEKSLPSTLNLNEGIRDRVCMFVSVTYSQALTRLHTRQSPTHICRAVLLCVRARIPLITHLRDVALSNFKQGAKHTPLMYHLEFAGVAPYQHQTFRMTRLSPKAAHIYVH